MEQPRSNSGVVSSTPTTAYKPVRVGGGADTVINLERRGASLPLPEGPGLPTASVWLRLFPSEVDYQDPAQLTPATGLQLGHFQIEERIGAGGMGAVFRAMDTRLQRAIALKILSPSLSRDEAAVQRFRNEARAAARLDHDNIARVYFIGEDQGLHFIAFEFITGNNLRNLIRERGRIDPAEAVNFVLQITSALRHTSANGVVHRDIKPSNIIITPSGRAKLVDLGLARKEQSESTADLTMAGTTLGTFDYISPEQAKDPRNVDVRSDIYSLGCTLYHMLTGEPPYPDGTVLKKLLDHQSGEPPDPTKKNRRVSDDLSLVCRKMMASDPKRRYQTPDQLTRDLMLVAGSLGLRGVNPEGLIWMSARRSMSDFWRQNIGVITMVSLLVAIVWGLRQYPNVSDGQVIGNAKIGSGHLAQKGVTPGHTNGSLSTAGQGAHSSALPKDLTAKSTVQTGNLTPLDRNPSKSLHEEPRSRSETDDGQSFVPTKLFPSAPDELLNDPSIQPLSTRLERLEIVKAPTTGAKSEATKDAGASAIETGRDNGGSPERLPTTADDNAGVFVLTADGAAAKRFPTLESACAAVADGSVIELRYNGRRIEKPLRLSKKHVTIRAAKGFRPIVDFSPSSTTADAHLRLISVSSGPVHINGVMFEVSVPQFFSVDRISLFSVDRSEHLRLQSVAITLNNPGQRPASLFDLSSEPGQMLADMKMSTSGMSRDPLKIDLTDCFVRGHGDLFHVRHTKPVRLSLRDSAVTLDGSLLRVEGSSEKPAEQTRVELQLDHVTGLLSQSLVRMDSGDLPRELPPVAVNASNNVLTTTGSTPLVVMSGNTRDEDFRKLFLWTGEKNFYDRCDLFWAFASGVEPFGFDDWKMYWGVSGDVGSSNEKLAWSASRTDLVQSTIDSLKLNPVDASSSPAVAAASDGKDAGADLAKLPRTE